MTYHTPFKPFFGHFFAGFEHISNCNLLYNRERYATKNKKKKQKQNNYATIQLVLIYKRKIVIKVYREEYSIKWLNDVRLHL